MTPNNIIKVTAESNKKRLDIFLSENTVFSRSQIQKMIKNKMIMINDKLPKKTGDQIKTDDTITIMDIGATAVDNNQEQAEKQVQETQFTINDIGIIKETDDYLIINKPTGLIAHPTEKNETNTLSGLLVKKYPELENVGDDKMRPGIVHRLDKDASGLLVVARTQIMFEHLKNQFKNREIHKEYTILVHGAIEADYDKINFPIVRGKNNERMTALPIPKSIREQEAKLKDYKKMSHVQKQYEKSRDALTEFWIEKRFINFTLLKVKIHTGRMHQIRVHMLAYNHPVVGDNIYWQKNQKRKADELCGRLFLHSTTLGFEDLNGDSKIFNSDLPNDLKEFLKTIK